MGVFREFLSSVSPMKESLRVEFEKIGLFGVKWVDLEDRYGKMDSSLADKFDNLAAREGSLDEKMRAVGLREEEVAARELLAAEKLKAAVTKEEEVEAFVRRSNEELTVCSVELEMKNQELLFLKNAIEQKAKKQEREESRLCSIRRSISDHCKELVNQKMKLRECKLESAKLEQQVEHLSKEVRLSERKLVSLCDTSAQYSRKVQSSKDGLVSLRETLSRIRNDLELKEREYGGMSIKVKACNAELEAKTIELESLQTLVVDWEGEVKFREDRCREVDRSVAEYSDELLLKQVELDVVQVSLRECFDNLASEQAELDAVRSKKVEFDKDIEARLANYQSLVGLCDKRSEMLETKEKKLEERLMEFKSQQEKLAQAELNVIRSERDEFDKDIEVRLADYHSLMAVCEQRSERLEAKEKKLAEQLLEFKSQQEQLNQQRKAELVDGFDAHCVLKDTTDLLFFVCEFLERHDFVLQKVLHVLESSPDPAMFVLETIQLFEHENLVKSSRERKFTDGISKRCCLLLLSLLNGVSKNIAVQVRESASKLASQWKAMLKPSSPDYTLEAMTLLRLFMVFELNSALCPNELKDFVKSLSEKEQVDGPQGALPLPAKWPTPDTNPQSGVKKRSLHRPRGEDHTQPKPVHKRARLENEWRCPV